MKRMRGPKGVSGLRKLSKDCGGGILVEVGSFAGESASIFAESGMLYEDSSWSVML